MFLYGKYDFANKNDFRICFVDIGLEDVAEAATLVCGLPSHRDKNGFKNAAVYNHHAKLMIFVSAEARNLESTSTSL